MKWWERLEAWLFDPRESDAEKQRRLDQEAPIQSHDAVMQRTYPEAEVVHLSVLQCMEMGPHIIYGEWFQFGPYYYYIERTDMAGRAWRVRVPDSPHP